MKRLGLGDLGAGRRKDASEKIEGLTDFPIRVPKTSPNLPQLDMPNYCVQMQLNSEFKPIKVK